MRAGESGNEEAHVAFLLGNKERYLGSGVGQGIAVGGRKEAKAKGRRGDKCWRRCRCR
jgi:hypothetical protein